MSGRGGGRGGRDRLRRENSTRFEERSSSGSMSNRNPPSRHLWVGNISHTIVEHDLTRHFLQFGELDSVAFQPGRSYAFVNYFKDEDAIAAMRSLQGFPLAGSPLRIEFAKADKASAPSRDEDYAQFRDEQRYVAKESPLLQEFRSHHASPDTFYHEKSKNSDRNAEPSEVLWIGFPASLKVDESILGKAFSPFGEIEKISTFPGRSYAFVRFRSVMSASRAKDTLHGKLFGNPRVHICFAKNESGSSNSGRSSANPPLSPNYKSNDRQGFTDNFHPDNFASLTGNPGIRSPQFFSDMDAGDLDSYGFHRKGTWTNESNAYEPRRAGNMGSKFGGPSQDMYGHHSSPTKERFSHLHDIPQRFPHKNPYPEDSWDLPDDVQFYHGSKKLKTGPFPPDKELPEYTLSEFRQEKHIFPKLYSDIPPSEAFERNFESPNMGYKQIPDRPMKATQPYGEKSEHMREPYDSLRVSGSQPPNAVGRKPFAPESEKSSVTEWKWEGTIAKGGTPVCRARCFPVGKFLDMKLPEFLDCTARTSLDMLSKHYYEAATAWVVFFVPESDSDIGFYNEFMNYLGEKQRAAVAKLDNETTLFLVPPSDFSQNVLKVPGKLSISGVILRLERPGSNFGSERQDSHLLALHGEPSYAKQSASSASVPPMSSLSDFHKPGVNNLSLLGNIATSASPAIFSGSADAVGRSSNTYNENKPEYPTHQQNTLGPNWSSHHLQNSESGNRNIQSQASRNYTDSTVHEHQLLVPREVQETSSSYFPVGNTPQETRPALIMPTTSLQPEQLAQLASSLLGQQQRQSLSSTNISMGENLMQRNTMNEMENQFGPSKKFALQNNQVNSDLPTSHFGQFQQRQLPPRQQTSTMPVSVHQTAQRELQTVSLGNQQVQNSTGTQEEAEADPQKRLQATLQLAAALLQQIQQGKGS